jgi:ATP-dependent Clp protease protease subunit
MGSLHLDEKTRHIYVAGFIDDSLANQIIVMLHRLEETDGDILIVVNSEGGEEVAGYALYDAVTMCKNMVIVEVYGELASIGVLLLQAADIRRMSPNSYLMLHSGTIPVDDKEPKQNLIVEMADQIKKDNLRYYAILSGRSKLSVSDIEEACNKDSYYMADEALSVGLCDEILVTNKKFEKPKRKKKK